MRSEIITLGLLLVFIGMLLIFFGILSETLKAKEGEKSGVRGGGVILIGPIPIVFGTDVGAIKWVLILTIIVMILAILFFSGKIKF